MYKERNGSKVLQRSWHFSETCMITFPTFAHDARRVQKDKSILIGKRGTCESKSVRLGSPSSHGVSAGQRAVQTGDCNSVRFDIHLKPSHSCHRDCLIFLALFGHLT